MGTTQEKLLESLQFCDTKSVLLYAKPGVTIEPALREALATALTLNVEVVIVHNSTSFSLKPSEIINTILKTSPNG